MSTRKERSLRNRKAHAAERGDAPMSAPLDEEPPRDDLASIPWNKVALTARQRRAVAQAILNQYPRNEIARALGVTVKTLKRILNEEPELTDAVDAAKEAEEAELRDCLMRSARRGSDVAALFLLKARHGYVDRADPKSRLDDFRGGVLVVPAPIKAEEFEAMALRQQAPYRERREEGTVPLSIRTLTPGIEGLRLERPRRCDLPS